MKHRDHRTPGDLTDEGDDPRRGRPHGRTLDGGQIDPAVTGGPRRGWCREPPQQPARPADRPGPPGAEADRGRCPAGPRGGPRAVREPRALCGRRRARRLRQRLGRHAAQTKDTGHGQKEDEDEDAGEHGDERVGEDGDLAGPGP
ncbi:hypothetical protein [Kitasatospora sp. NBC_01266]|uniref:hypothetical protein n=1 Tax=Kitasatospora sp. NBC_01266 TaxID=2903572 RepID=UPI002E30526F|nr:hypothetical protein [Kitasatospora sp. NBC_01266]